MFSLYLDNFRGFDDTVIDLKQVNFLVGENSTGKTSLMSLVGLINDPQFWFNQEFNTGEINLGFFDEIVSAGSSQRDSFKVGFKFPISSVEEEKAKQVECYLLTFSDRDGTPTLTELRYESDEIEYFANILPTSISFHVFRHGNAEKSTHRAPFSAWIKRAVSSASDLIKIETKHSVRLPLFALHSIIVSHLQRGDPKVQFPQSLQFPPFVENNLAWVAPIRAKPRRIYETIKTGFSPEGDHTPYLLNQILSPQRSTSKRKTDFEKMLKKFGSGSALFSGVKIHNYGSDRTAPFDIQIVLNGKKFRMPYVGYGVSQVLPILVECFVRPAGAWFAIQQPEVHLHPKAQAALGELILDLASREKKGFIIETHSDFLIDRFRLGLSGGQKSVIGGTQILFFERAGSGNRVSPVAIEPTGRLSEHAPKGYRDFFVREQLDLLGI